MLQVENASFGNELNYRTGVCSHNNIFTGCVSVKVNIINSRGVIIKTSIRYLKRR